ncbi:hypothetical protein [Sphingopyxis sp. PET50]|uniref:hypothetical protein n=1 Tax=Sphingopyxis sp. PET50 TaxID=2976533 RepID=UPI0021AEAEFE|nr:hypothetical protein [Sphingopyxis sp. PET50]
MPATSGSPQRVPAPGGRPSAACAPADRRGAQRGPRARLGQDIFGAQRMTVTGVALHPADRRRGIERACQAVAGQCQPVHQFDEARPAMRREVGEQRHEPAMAGQLGEQRIGHA